MKIVAIALLTLSIWAALAPITGLQSDAWADLRQEQLGKG